jgi:hypothetical protein
MQSSTLLKSEPVGQIVDTPSARDFMQEALQKISEEELAELVAELREKSSRFRRLLALEALPVFDEKAFRTLLRSIYSTRRHVRAVMAQVSVATFRQAVGELLHGDKPLAERFDAFCAQLEPLDLASRCDLAGECLHYWEPERYWLWTRWVWDGERNTGGLPLVLVEEHNLQGCTPGLTYLKLGEAMIYLNGVGEAAGFQKGGRGLLGTDVYLACVYTVYLYTVLRLRMTREFTTVIPAFPELIRRLLGIFDKMEV